jgi:hypothetical protein
LTVRGDARGRKEQNDKWNTVTSNCKTKDLLNSKPKPELHNAFAILFKPSALTHYDAPIPTQQMDDDRTIIPPSPQEHCRQGKIAWPQQIKQTLRRLHKSDHLFLNNSITLSKGQTHHHHPE